MATPVEKQLPASTVKEPMLGINGVPMSASYPTIPPPPSDDDGLTDGGARAGAVAALAAPAAAARTAAPMMPPMLSFYDAAFYPPNDTHRAAMEMQKRMQNDRVIQERARQALAEKQHQQWAAEAAQTTAQQAAACTAQDRNEEHDDEYEEHPIEVQARLGVGGLSGKSWQQWDTPELVALINAGAFVGMQRQRVLKGLVVSGHLTIMYITQTVDQTEVFKYLGKKASGEDGGATSRWKQVMDRVNNSCPERPKTKQRAIAACRGKWQELMKLGVAYMDGKLNNYFSGRRFKHSVIMQPLEALIKKIKQCASERRRV